MWSSIKKPLQHNRILRLPSSSIESWKMVMLITFYWIFILWLKTNKWFACSFCIVTVINKIKAIFVCCDCFQGVLAERQLNLKNVNIPWNLISLKIHTDSLFGVNYTDRLSSNLYGIFKRINNQFSISFNRLIKPLIISSAFSCR